MEKQVLKETGTSYTNTKEKKDKVLKSTNKVCPTVRFIMDNPNTEEQTQKIATYLFQQAIMPFALEQVERHVQESLERCSCNNNSAL
jgi:hypothetical protein